MVESLFKAEYMKIDDQKQPKVSEEGNAHIVGIYTTELSTFL